MPGAPRRRWRVRPGEETAALRELDASWDGLERSPGAAVLKSNPVRQVIALPAAPGRPAVVVKRYHVRGLSDRLAHLLRPSRARREWRALVALEAAGIPSARPLGWFETRRGPWLDGAGLVMERLEGVVPLPALLGTADEGEERRADRDAARAPREPPPADALRRLRATGALVARLHRAGIVHPDLHLGNFLGSPSDPDDVRLIDLHAAGRRRRVSAARRRRDLAKLVHSLGEEESGAPLAREVLSTYIETSRRGGSGPAPLGALDAELDLVSARAREIERVRLASRDRRCFRTTSQFVAERRGRFRVHRRRTIAAETLAPLLDGSARPLRTLAAGPGSSRVEVELPGAAGARVLVVETRARGALAGFLDRLRRGPLARAWGASRRLEVRDLPHVRAEALIEERQFGATRREILVTERLAGRTLADEVRARAGSPRELERFLRRAIAAIAPQLAAIHRAGILHEDLGPSHWLVVDGATGGEAAPAGSFVPIALDRVIPRGALSERERRRNLCDLALLPLGLGTPRLRLGFLLEYLRRRDGFESSGVAGSAAGLHGASFRDLVRDLDRELARRRVERIEALAAIELATAAARAEGARSARPGAALAAHAGAPAARGTERAG